MKRAHSFLGLALTVVSTAILGCAHTDSEDRSMEAEMRSEKVSAAEEPRYGYEMLPLQLKSGATAPIGDSMLPNGRVAPEEVLRQATNRIDALRTCYVNALAVDPTISGQIRAIHDFRADGELRSLRIESDLALSPEFKDCLTAALSTMHMPASNVGGFQVDYPITLDPLAISSAP